MRQLTKKALALASVLLVALAFTACQTEPPRLASDPVCVSIGTSALRDNPNNYNCPSDYPTKTNVGMPNGTVLASATTGDIWTSYDGQVFDAINNTGQIHVRHNNVVIKNSVIQNNVDVVKIEKSFDVSQDDPASHNWHGPDATGLTIQDSDLHNTGPTFEEGSTSAVCCHNFTFVRNTVTGYPEGLGAYGDAYIADNWFGDWFECPGDINYLPGTPQNWGCHQDGIQVEWGSNVTIRHNTMVIGANGMNAAIFLNSHDGTNNLAEDNLLFSFGGKELVVYAGNARNNKIVTTLTRDPDPAGSLLWGTYLGSHIEPGDICGTTYYDGPNAGQYLQWQAAC